MNKVSSSEDPDDRVTVLSSIYGDGFGPAYVHQRALRRPSPFWSQHKLFRVVNYTRPHCPGCQAVLTPKGEVQLLSAICHGLKAADPVGAFNRVALKEGRPVAAKEVRDYLRFVLECYVGVFAPAHFLATPEDLARARAGAEKPGGWPESLPLEKVPGGWLLRAHYGSGGRISSVRLRLRMGDGTIELSWEPAP